MIVGCLSRVVTIYHVATEVPRKDQRTESGRPLAGSMKPVEGQPFRHTANCLGADNLKLAVVVAMPAVRVVQVAIDQIVDVITVRNRRVSAIWAMNVAECMTRTSVLRSAGRRICRVDWQHVLVNGAIGFRVMQVPIVEVINVAIVLDGGMTAVLAVFVIVMSMNVAGMSHDRNPFKTWNSD